MVHMLGILLCELEERAVGVVPLAALLWVREDLLLPIHNAARHRQIYLSGTSTRQHNAAAARAIARPSFCQC